MIPLLYRLSYPAPGAGSAPLYAALSLPVKRTAGLRSPRPFGYSERPSRPRVSWNSVTPRDQSAGL